jgi:hypothetical protein
MNMLRESGYFWKMLAFDVLLHYSGHIETIIIKAKTG